jgi:hypothetical protein
MHAVLVVLPVVRCCSAMRGYLLLVLQQQACRFVAWGLLQKG